MAAFIALKPCRFGSVDYRQGDTIPDGAVLPKRVLSMTRMGYIAPALLPNTQEAAAGGQQGAPQTHPASPENGEQPSPEGQQDAPEASADKKTAAKGGKKQG